MDAAGFGAFQHQLKQNQDELQDYLRELESWKDTISQRDNNLKQQNTNEKKNSKSSTSAVPKETLPPVRNSLHKKRKIKKKRVKDENTSDHKTTKISGFDFRAWDKFDVDKALKEVDDQSDQSSYDEETDEEWEQEKLKQQALFEKDQGNDCFKKGKYNEAVQYYTKGITCDPTNAVLYANRAMAMLKQEKFGAVEVDCTDAIALDPAYVKAYMRRGTARYKLGKLEAALDDYRQVIRLDPDNKLAEREIISIEKDLKISREGIVLPIKKQPKDRSKKPLRRIEIQEIDDNDMRSKLNDAVAQTISQQSSEKKRIVALDNQAFAKFTNSKEETKTADASSVELLKDAVKSAPTKLNIEQLNAKHNNGLQNTQTAAQSPLSSPRAPGNSFQFQRDWKAVKSDLDRAYEYLKLINPADYSKLIGEFLEANMMNVMLEVYLNRFLRDSVSVTEHLLSLAKVKRFGMTVMLMSNSEKKVLRDICDKLRELKDCNEEHLTTITRLYEL